MIYYHIFYRFAIVFQKNFMDECAIVHKRRIWDDEKCVPDC